MQSFISHCFVIGLQLIGTSAYAQDYKVIGKISDSNGRPLPGVSVMVQRIKPGTITYIDGICSLDALSKASQIENLK